MWQFRKWFIKGDRTIYEASEGTRSRWVPPSGVMVNSIVERGKPGEMDRDKFIYGKSKLR